MFDKLLDLLIQFGDSLLPFEVIDHYERGVVLRLGKFDRVLEPGFHWVYPFVDRVLSDIVMPTTINLGSQTCVTQDGKTVVVSGVVTRSISNIKDALLECESVDSVLKDSCYGAIAKTVRLHTYEELLNGNEFNAEMTQEVRRRAGDYGIKIHRVQLSDIAPTRAYSLYKT